MGKEIVVGLGRHNVKNINRAPSFGEAFANPTIRPAKKVSPAYPETTEKPGSAGEARLKQLSHASEILTRQGSFTVADVHEFTDAMLGVTGSNHIGEGVEVSAVPDRIPKTGVKGMTIHQEVTPTGVSVNVVYETVGDQPDQRYVIGENFGRGVTPSNSNTLNVGKSESPIRDLPAENANIVRIDHNAPPDIDADKLRRKVCEDVYVAYLADADRIERSRDAAATVRELIHHGTPVTTLESSN